MTTQEKKIFDAKDDHQLNQITNWLFRPEIKVPRFLITDNFQKSSSTLILAKKLQAPGLSDAAKVQLLTGMDPYGIPELKRVMSDGNLDDMRALVRLILDSGLSDETRTKLLAAEDYDGTALTVAAVAGKADLVDAFRNLILESDLPQTAKAQLRGPAF